MKCALVYQQISRNWTSPIEFVHSEPPPHEPPPPPPSIWQTKMITTPLLFKIIKQNFTQVLSNISALKWHQNHCNTFCTYKNMTEKQTCHGEKCDATTLFGCWVQNAWPYNKIFLEVYNIYAKQFCVIL